MGRRDGPGGASVRLAGAEKWTGRLAVAALAAAMVFVFADQPRDDGFRRGHRGWVSAHTLAIVERSGPENGFVGYTLSLLTERSRDLYYFDRYPTFFAAGLEAVQDLLASSSIEEIRISRHVMNVVYALTLAMSVLLLAELGLATSAAVAVTALAGASATMVAFRDMVHFDQPAVLGIVALLWSIARYRHGGSPALVVAMSVAAVCAGRGYASFAVLGAWWIFESASMLARRRAGEPGFLRTVATGVPTLACLVAIAAGTACLGYNVVMESRIRGIPVSEAGIIRSAWQRLSLDEGFNDRNEKRIGWSQVVASQQSGVAHGVLPFLRRDPIPGRPWLRVLVSAGVVTVAIAFAATRDASTRTVWLTAVVAGPLWLLVMRNLAAFHQYTAIYMLPLCLTFFAALLGRLRGRAATLAAFAACALLVHATAESNRMIVRQTGTSRQDTLDMMAIERALAPGDAFATEKQILRGVPYALGFYLPDHDVVIEGPASLVVSRRRRFNGENLTPGNAGIFLYRPDQRWFARSSLARHHRQSTAAQKVKIRHATGRKPKRP
jgi:hypothetical protein